MSNNKISIPTGEDGQSTLTNPEKLTAAIFAIGLGVVGFMFLDVIMSAILSLLLTTLGVIALVAIVMVLAAVLLNEDIRRAGFYLFKMAMRKVAGLVYTIDPIEVAKITLDETRQERKKLQEQITIVSKQHGDVAYKVQTNSQQIKERFDYANEAQTQGNEGEASIAAIEGAALQEFNDRLIPIAADTEKVLTFLEKIDKATEFAIREMDIKIRIKEAEYKIVKATHSAMSTAINIFNGGSDKNYAFVTAMDYVQRDMGEKLGEIRNAMKLSSQFVEGVDIKNGVYEKKGLDMLEKYNTGKLLNVSQANVNPLANTMRIPTPLNASRNSHLLD